MGVTIFGKHSLKIKRKRGTLIKKDIVEEIKTIFDETYLWGRN